MSATNTKLQNQIAAYNSHVGQVFATEHALERFHEYTINNLSFQKARSSRSFKRKFKESFGRAELTDIGKSNRTKRLINNRFQPVLYLFDRNRNLRFIVLEREPVIVTVERPQ